MGQRRPVDTQEAGPGRSNHRCGRGVPAVLVPARTSEAGRFHEGGGSGPCGSGQPAGEGIFEGLSEAFHRTVGVVDEPGGGAIQDHAFHRIGGGGAATAHRVRKRGESSAGKSDYTGEGVCDPVGARREPLETDPTASGGEPDSGDRRGGGGNSPGMGRVEVPGGADAAKYHPGGSGNWAEYTGAGVYAGCSDANRVGVWSGARAEGSTQGFERTVAG